MFVTTAYQNFILVGLLTFVYFTCGDPDSQLDTSDLCFCKLKGQIGDCSCNVDTVDHFNNAKIHPRLNSLLSKDYFRFYKVNLKSECPFWADDSRCAIKHCHVKPCLDEEIPAGLKGHSTKKSNHENEDMSLKYLRENQQEDCDEDKKLGSLNKTISPATYEEFALWQAHDDAQDNFCTFPDEDGKAEYVDLFLNPERFTGYKGASAHRIWRSIYLENCFRPKNSYGQLIPSSHLDGMCLEKRVFYRVLSGLHTSINIHLCANYLFSDKLDLLSKGKESGGKWGLNLQEFRDRFSPETTDGEGPQWLRNLYFTYLLELRAIVKAAPYLEKELYYTGNKEEDELTRAAIKDFLSVAKKFPDHFNETTMFSGGKQARKLKEEFRQHFRNISKIMDCVGCEKCQLWGKLQVQGLGTALKILFSGKFDEKIDDDHVLSPVRRDFSLKRSEIVALFNAIGRLSNSIYNIEAFRRLMR